MTAGWNRRGWPRTVVTNTEPQQRVGVGKLHVDRRARGVPPRVRESLLDDAVSDELDVGVEGDGRASKDQPCRTTGRLSCFVDQLSHLIKARLGAPVGNLDTRIVTQHAQQSAHLQKRLAGRVADRREPLSSGRRKSGNGEPSCLGLDRDHRDVVGDYVVQLPGDAGPFAPCGVVDERVDDDLACRAVLFRLADVHGVRGRPERQPGRTLPAGP